MPTKKKQEQVHKDKFVWKSGSLTTRPPTEKEQAQIAELLRKRKGKNGSK